MAVVAKWNKVPLSEHAIANRMCVSRRMGRERLVQRLAELVGDSDPFLKASRRAAARRQAAWRGADASALSAIQASSVNGFKSRVTRLASPPARSTRSTGSTSG